MTVFHVRLNRRFALLVLALFMAVAACGGHGAAASADETVRLIVDYGDGTSKTIANLPWAKGNTVLDAMKAAADRPHGISFGFTGSGDAAVVTKIDDVQNQGGGAAKKNWQFRVNGRDGDRSFAVFELQPRDLIVWRFTTDQGK